MAAAGFRRAGVSVCLHHHRLRRGLGISLADRLGDDAENAGARIAHSRHRLRRDGHGDDGRADGDDRGVCACSRANISRSTQRRADRSGREDYCGRFSGDGSRQMDELAHNLGENNHVRSRGRRADVRRGHGAYVFARFFESDGAGALVSLCHHVRSAVYPDDDRCRHAGGAISAAGFVGQFLATARQYAIVERQFLLPACCWSARGAGSCIKEWSIRSAASTASGRSSVWPINCFPSSRFVWARRS